jgi:hypothetical protein
MSLFDNDITTKIDLQPKYYIKAEYLPGVESIIDICKTSKDGDHPAIFDYDYGNMFINGVNYREYNFPKDTKLIVYIILNDDYYEKTAQFGQKMYTWLDDAFMNKKQLKIIELHNIYSKYYPSMFEGCSNLESVKFINNIPESFTIKNTNFMFKYCEKIKYIDLSGLKLYKYNNDMRRLFGLSYNKFNDLQTVIMSKPKEGEGMDILYDSSIKEVMNKLPNVKFEFV